MSETPAPRASAAPGAPQTPAPAHGGPDGSADATAARTEVRKLCAADGCKKPRGNRLIILVDPDGNDGTTFGPWCDDETDRLIKNLIQRYSDGRPTYRVEEVDHA